MQGKQDSLFLFRQCSEGRPECDENEPILEFNVGDQPLPLFVTAFDNASLLPPDHTADCRAHDRTTVDNRASFVEHFSESLHRTREVVEDPRRQ